MEDVEGFLEWLVLQAFEWFPDMESNEGFAYRANPRGEVALSVPVTASVRGLERGEGGGILQLGLL